jgi:hypothetical protein
MAGHELKGHVAMIVFIEHMPLMLSPVAIPGLLRRRLNTAGIEMKTSASNRVFT